MSEQAAAGQAGDAGTGAAVTATVVEAWLGLELAGVAASGERAPRLRPRAVGAGYTETAVVGRVRPAERGAWVEFALPASADFARLELVAVPGRYAIESARVDGQDIADLPARAIAASSDFRTDDGCVIFGDRHDAPALELDLRGLRDAPGGGTLGVQLRRLAGGMQDARAEEARRSLHAAVDAVDGSLREFSAVMHRRLEAMRGEDRERHAQVVSAMQALRDGAGDAARAGAQIAAIEASLPALQDGAGQAVRASAQLAALEALVLAQAQRIEALADDLQAVRNGIENVFWRRWIRALRGRE